MTRIMRPTTVLLLLLSSLLFINCRNTAPLSQAESEKLDRALQRLVTGQSLSRDSYTISTRDGDTVYSVLIRTDDPERLSQSNVPIGTVNGNIVTARLTIDQIREAASLPFVRSIANPERARPQSNEN
jgi:lipopolysaccharide export LptBFGC system permease protein LptF